MGTKKKRLEQFLAMHPVCCYCGGRAAAESEDHWPSRSIFHDRKWPNGYVFPACISCNQATAEDETVFAFLCRLSPAATNDDRSSQSLKLLKAIEEIRPDLFSVFKRSVTQKTARSTVRLGEAAPIPSSRDFAVSIDHPAIPGIVERCATKLFLSLYYFYTGRILRPEGGVVFRWGTNATDMRAAGVDLLKPLLDDKAKVAWQKVNLEDQFHYDYGLFGPGSLGMSCAFLISFHESMWMAGVVFENIDNQKAPLVDSVLRPFSG